MTKKNKNRALKLSATILVCAIIVGVILSFVLFLTETQIPIANASIQFTFEGAANGIAPNNTKYGIDGIRSEEVLSSALRIAGLDNRYTWDVIQPSLYTVGVYPEDIDKQVTSFDSLLDFNDSRKVNVREFFPTQFSVSLNGKFDANITNEELQRLLQIILDEYRVYFVNEYSVGFDTEEYEALFALETYDYPQMLQIIQNDMMQNARYAEELYGMDPTFRYKGQGFNDVYVMINNLMDNDIVRMNANLTMNALTKDTTRLLMQYRCAIDDDKNELKEEVEKLARLDALLKLYEKNEIIYLSTSDSLTKIDGNSSETYDALVAKRKEVADGITVIRTRISDNEQKISDLMGQSNLDKQSEVVSEEQNDLTDKISGYTNKDAIAILEEDIAELLIRKDAVLSQFEDMIDAYNQETLTQDAIMVTNARIATRKILSGSFAVKAIKTTGPICVIALIICMVLLILEDKKMHA